LSFEVLSVICRLHNLWSPFKSPFYLVPTIVFSFRAPAFLLWDHMPLFMEWHLRVTLKVPWWPPYSTSAEVLKFKIVPIHVKCWILLKPVLGVDGSLHLTVPSMNRFNQTEPATFSDLSCWAIFRDSYFSILCFLFLNYATTLSMYKALFDVTIQNVYNYVFITNIWLFNWVHVEFLFL
jgi:hypothetical protein